MIFICVFVLYTSVAHAQTVTGETVWTWEALVLESVVTETTVSTSSSSSEVTTYINRLLAMQKQAKWKNSPAFSEWNYAFFEWFNKQLALIPSDDHIDMVNYTLKQITALTTAEATKKFNIQKWIIVAVLTWIKEIVENDNIINDWDDDSNDDDWDDLNDDTDYKSNSLYTVDKETVAWVDYYIYKLNKQHSIKYADFHDDKWSFVHCMYSQCNSLNFSETRLPKKIFVQYSLWEKNEIIDLTKSTWLVKKEIYNDDDNSEDSEMNKIDDLFAEEKSVTTKTTTKTTTTTFSSDNDDSDLLQELSDIFWWAF